MKYLIIIPAIVCACLAVPVPYDEANKGFIEVIGEDNQLHLVDLNENVNVDLLSNIQRNPGNRYFLFTRRNPTSAQLLATDNAESITNSNFNSRVPTVFIAHGYLGNENANLNPLIRDAYLRTGDFNVIVVDWSQVAMTSYLLAISNIPNVGRDLGRFLNFLSGTTGASLQTMHLVGFSLGSHVVGNGGRTVGGRVGRVTGLDPYSPIWNNNNNRLARTDGIYVEVIHTNGNSVNPAMGDVDFYPNGGRSQPGCITSICNHNRSWELFASTVVHNHLVGVECGSAEAVSSNTCQGRTLNMGNSDMNKSGSGLYRLTTTASYPY